MAPPRRTRTSLLIAAASISAVACTSGPGAQRPVAASPSGTPACERHHPTRLVAVTGRDAANATLRPLTLCPTSLGAPIGTPRVSWVSATSDRVVVAEASARQDRIAAVEDGAFTPIEGIGGGTAFAPNLAADGRIAYVRRNRNSGNDIHVWSPSTRTSRVIYRSPALVTSAGWGPRGELALVEPRGTSRQLVIIDANGTPRRRDDVRLPDGAYDVRWSASDRLLIRSTGREPVYQPISVIIDLRTSQQHPLPAKWSGVGWTPDGRDLLVTNYTTTELALLTGPEFTEVLHYGVVPGGPVRGAAWISR